MESKSRKPKGHDDTLPSLIAAISALDRAGDDTSMKSAKDLSASTSVLLATIKVSFFLILVSRQVPDARRIRSSTKPTVWNWGSPAPMFVKPLGGGRMEGLISLINQSSQGSGN